MAREKSVSGSFRTAFYLDSHGERKIEWQEWSVEFN